jgi:spermidine/putrescine transport system ATP-binding protein
MDDFVRFENVSRTYGAVRAVDKVTLSVAKGEFFALLGPSGCGKTTLLRMLAGFERPDEGRVFLGGQDMTDLPPHRRKVNTIFQSYALFPHLNVRENIAFGLRIAGRPKAEIEREVDRMLALMQMEDQGHKKTDQISGGQKQRVAIARALVNKPEVLLLDEPLAALDLKLRQRMLVELDAIHDEVGITFIYVTHDQGEAMGLSDRIAVMNRGRIEQLGTPVEIYEAPRTSFVAAFIGDTNFFEGVVIAVEGERCRVAIEGYGDVDVFNDNKLQMGDPVSLSVRPEKLRIAREEPPRSSDVNTARAIVEDVIYLGGETKYWVRTGNHRIAVTQQHHRILLDERPIRWNEDVFISWHADDGYMLERSSPGDDRDLPRPASGSPSSASAPRA